MGFSLSVYISHNPASIFYIIRSIYVSAIIVSLVYIYKFISMEGLDILLFENPSMETIAQIASINVGFGGGRNLFASWLAFSLTFALPIMISTYKNIRLLLIPTSIIMIIPLVLTLSRTALLSLIVFGFLIIIFTEDKKLKMTAIKIIGVLFSTITLMVIFNIFNIGSFFITRFYLIFESFQGESVDYGVMGRLELWHYAIKSIIEYPILGTGIGTLYKGWKEIGGVHNYHNIFLQFWAQLGIIGLSIFILWSIFLIYISYKTYKKLRKFSHSRLYYLSFITFLNINIYYFKSLLMFQYFDLEIWTLIGITGGLFAIVYSGGFKWEEKVKYAY